MKYGFIYEFAKFVVWLSYKLNLVEWVKDGFAYLDTFRGKVKNEYFSKSWAIDVYVFLKWLILFLFWNYSIYTNLTATIIIYLIWSNLFTYFYYHIWDNRTSSDVEWQRRRFIMLIQSIAFNIFGFAFLYECLGINNFTWTKEVSDISVDSIKILLYSIMSLFGSNSSIGSANTYLGLLLTSIQISINFIFLTIVLSNTQISKDSNASKR